MGEHIDIDRAELRRLAGRHGEAAEYLRNVPANHQDIQHSIDSLGPIFGDFQDAARELLEQRSRCYRGQADAHDELAEQLEAAAAVWDDHENSAAARIRAVLDGP